LRAPGVGGCLNPRDSGGEVGGRDCATGVRRRARQSGLRHGGWRPRTAHGPGALVRMCSRTLSGRVSGVLHGSLGAMGACVSGVARPALFVAAYAVTSHLSRRALDSGKCGARPAGAAREHAGGNTAACVAPWGWQTRKDH
jgi:hypothetical protein